LSFRNSINRRSLRQCVTQSRNCNATSFPTAGGESSCLLTHCSPPHSSFQEVQQ
jgi:hypothetical protein